MELKLSKQTAETLNSSLIIPIFQPEKPSKANSFKSRFSQSSWKLMEKLDSKLSATFLKQLKDSSFSAKAGQSEELILPHRNSAIKVQLVGFSDPEESYQTLLKDLRILGARAQQGCKSELSVILNHLPSKLQQSAVKAVAEGALTADYKFNRYFKSKGNSKKKKLINLVVSKPQDKKAVSALREANSINTGVKLTRDLVNTPAADMGPADLLQAAKGIAKQANSQISVKSFGKQALKKMKAGALLSVTAGSSTEPQLIHLDYKPRGKASKTVVLVGKGVTFDSGGLSIKSGRGMMTMKCDMAGAGAVLGVMQAIASLPAALKPKVRVHAVVPTCENMINANCTHPGDVVRSMSGKSIEVLNTDAEGRLILADALHYSKKLKADQIIDLATLTGACVVALGDSYAGLFSNDQDLEEELQDNGELAGEHLWPLPLADEYDKYLRSDIADVKNIGSPGPGAITAALFLRHFVPKDTSWAHIDIAGPAFLDGGNSIYRKGATGFPVRALCEFLRT